VGVDADYVRERTPILELVHEAQELLGYTTGLVHPDSDYDQKTRCPVHYDQNPSAKVYLGSNSVYCWVCGRTWDPLSLYAAVHGVSYRRATRTLMARLGASPDPAGGVGDMSATIAHYEALIAPPQPHTPDADDVDAWLDSVLTWVRDRPPHVYPALDPLDEALEGWLRHVDPPTAVLDEVKRILAWCHRIDPLIPPCPALAPDVLALSGLT